MRRARERQLKNKWGRRRDGRRCAARIVRRFHRQAARANLHCGWTFRVGVGYVRVAILGTSTLACRSVDTHPRPSRNVLAAANAHAKLITGVERTERERELRLFVYTLPRHSAQWLNTLHRKRAFDRGNSYHPLYFFRSTNWEAIIRYVWKAVRDIEKVHRDSSIRNMESCFNAVLSD